MTETEDRAAWSTSYINDLPDSAFADSEGRRYPHHDASGAVDRSHLANAMARCNQDATSCPAAVRRHLEAHASEMGMGGRDDRPPRDGLVRVEPGSFEVRDVADGGPVLTGRFAVFNQWTEINSISEGHFLERIAPGAFKKTFQEGLGRIKVLFNHGKDPSIGDQVLGMPSVLEEDEQGARYEVPLFEGVPPLVMSGLRGNAYGASFRFSAVAEDFNRKPNRSATNPEALPERTIREARVAEFGPVTFPAYAGATAGIRSGTDEYILSQLLANPETLVDLLTKIRASEALPPDEAAAEPHPEAESRPTPPATFTPPRRFRDQKEYLEWISSSSTR